MRKICLFFIISFCFLSLSAFDLKFNKDITNENFKNFVEEIAPSLYFNPFSPAEPLGILGFEVAIEATLPKTDKDNYKGMLSDVSDIPSYIALPRLHLQKGFFWNMDFGLMYSKMPSTNISLIGAEIKWAPFDYLKDNLFLPAFGVRGSYSKLLGVDDLNLQTFSFDLIASKNILIFTPYLGASFVKVKAEADYKEINLSEVNSNFSNYFGGLYFTPFPLFKIGGELALGENLQFAFKLALRF